MGVEDEDDSHGSGQEGRPPHPLPPRLEEQRLIREVELAPPKVKILCCWVVGAVVGVVVVVRRNGTVGAA